MITKSEVRALALARLGPRPGDLVWDVGAGSGSVAVECARLGAAVVAVEQDAGRGGADPRQRRRARRRRAGGARRRRPDVLAGLPRPGRRVRRRRRAASCPRSSRACARRARRTVVVAMAALDRVPAVRARARRDAGLDCDGVLLQSSRLAPLPGDVTRLAADQPRFPAVGRPAPGTP